MHTEIEGRRENWWQKYLVWVGSASYSHPEELMSFEDWLIMQLEAKDDRLGEDSHGL